MLSTTLKNKSLGGVQIGAVALTRVTGQNQNGLDLKVKNCKTPRTGPRGQKKLRKKQPHIIQSETWQRPGGGDGARLIKRDGCQIWGGGKKTQGFSFGKKYVCRLKGTLWKKKPGRKKGRARKH